MTTLALPLALSPRPTPSTSRRSVRPFAPTVTGPYTPPKAVTEALGAALAAFRNRDAAWTLAVMLARNWTAPGRLDRPFPIARVALAGKPGLGLTEARIQGAIRTLERIGFIDRVNVPGSRYRVSASGAVTCRPILFRFGPTYRPDFEQANRRAAKRAQRPAPARRPTPALSALRPSSAYGVPRGSSSLRKPPIGCPVLTEGKRPVPLPNPPNWTPDAGLEAAIGRMKSALICNRVQNGGVQS